MTDHPTVALHSYDSCECVKCTKCCRLYHQLTSFVCSVGTLANQTLNGLPAIATTSGQTGEPFNGALSFLPGQRLSACTCPNDPHHPGPKRADGTWVGRSAPEVRLYPLSHTFDLALISCAAQIDVIEAQVSSGANPIGHVSQSSQWAPFNPEYFWLNTSANLKIEDHDVSELNTYFGPCLAPPASSACVPSLTPLLHSLSLA